MLGESTSIITSIEKRGNLLGFKSFSITPKYKQLAYRLFGEWVKKREAKYLSLNSKLKEGRFFQTYDEYTTTALLTSTIIGVLGGLLGFALAYLLVITEALPTIYLNPDAAAFFQGFSPYKTTIFLISFPIICGLIFAVLSYKLIMVYPSFYSHVRKTKIDAELPHAVAFLYSMSLGGSNILQSIRTLAEREDVYGG